MKNLTLPYFGVDRRKRIVDIKHQKAFYQIAFLIKNYCYYFSLWILINFLLLLSVQENFSTLIFCNFSFDVRENLFIRLLWSFKSNFRLFFSCFSCLTFTCMLKLKSKRRVILFVKIIHKGCLTLLTSMLPILVLVIKKHTLFSLLSVNLVLYPHQEKNMQPNINTKSLSIGSLEFCLMLFLSSVACTS